MAVINVIDYWDPEASLEYNNFIADIINHHVPRWAKDIKESGCKIMIAFPVMRPSGVDQKYGKWCKANCNDKYYVYNENYVFFKTEEDAMAFKLRWI